jgi:hypothetical protein
VNASHLYSEDKQMRSLARGKIIVKTLPQAGSQLFES